MSVKVTRGKKLPRQITRDLFDKLTDMGFDPAEALVNVHREAWSQYEEFKGTKVAAEYLRIVESSASNMMQYTHPKRKSIEHNVKDEKDLGAAQVVFYLPKNGRTREEN